VPGPEGSGETGLRGFLKHNSLSLFFLVIFLAALIAQAIIGHDLFNDEQRAHGEETIGFWRYVASSHFAQAVTENWQSEYLQFALFAAATIWLLQKGSPESKELDKAGRESEKDQKLGRYANQSSPRWARLEGGVRRWIYSNSLLLVMAVIFIVAWFAQSVSGWTVFNDQQTAHGEPQLSWLSYIGTSDFWEATLQNWQSEFLAVGSFAVLTIYLRQRGSPESKPVGAPHEDATGQEG
jgi:ABC-type multidrug transport system fused ATPase/permease subunit